MSFTKVWRPSSDKDSAPLANSRTTIIATGIRVNLLVSVVFFGKASIKRIEPRQTLAWLPKSSNTMYANTNGTQDSAGIARYLKEREPIGFSYPSSGAFQHLPIRRTLTGAPAQAHPGNTKIFLRNLPAHCYILPSVPLNFTLVEIIVLLPNWFKNRAVAARFLNNNLTAALHFMILEKHRDLTFPTEMEREKARRTVTDEYRRVMRKVFADWTRAKHTAPSDWDYTSVSMGGFVPDDAQLRGYRQPAPISFRDLTVGVNKLPEGPDAGDLTRALQFALERPENYMFPDDLPWILEHIGRTQITMAHADRPTVRRYVEIKQREDDEKKLFPYQTGSNLSLDELPAHTSYPPPLHRPTVYAMTKSLLQDDQLVQMLQGGYEMVEVPLQQGYTPVEAYNLEQAHMPGPQAQAQQSVVCEVEMIPHPLQLVDVGMAASQAGYRLSATDSDHSGEEMDILLAPYLSQDNTDVYVPPECPSYAPHHLLRDCVEGNVGFDGSVFAQVARFAQQPDQIGTDWYVGDAAWLSQLLSIIQPNGSESEL